MFQRVCCAAVIFGCSLILGGLRAARAADSGNLADLIAKVEPSVVRIDATHGESKVFGSGYVIGEDGTVATNYHVIAGASEVTATFKNGDKVDVQGTVWLDPKRDIAILRINKQGLTPLSLADQLPRTGDSVAAIGAPVGLSFSASEGIVSAVRQGKELSEDDSFSGTWIQTTAPISPGNSGGPLVNQEGKVVAMPTFVLVVGQNLNFAISSLDVADALKKTNGKKMLPLADGAAKAKPNRRSSKSKNEIAAKDIPAAALETYVAARQKGYQQALSDARKKLTEAKEVLSAMKEGSTNAPKPQTGNGRRGTASNSAKASNNAPPNNGAPGPAANSDDPLYTVQMFKGQKYYHFPDLDTKQKCLAQQQTEVAQNEELVKKLDDSKQGLLNFVKSGGPELQLKSVGDLGFVSKVEVLSISDNDEFRTYLGTIPVIVRGIKTEKLAIGSKLDDSVMFVAGTESFRIESSKINIFVLREVPDDLLLEHLKGAPSGAAIAGGKASAVAGNVIAAKSATGATQTAVATKPDEIRTWSDKTGKYKIEAQLVTKVDDKVILKRRDNGEIITLVIDKLSTADQEFLKANATGTKP